MLINLVIHGGRKQECSNFHFAFIWKVIPSAHHTVYYPYHIVGAMAWKDNVHPQPDDESGRSLFQK